MKNETDSNVEEVFAENGIMASQRANAHKRMNSELNRRQYQLLIMDFGDRMIFCKVAKFC